MIADRFDLLVGEEILHRLVVEALGDGVKRQGKQLKPHHKPVTPASVGAVSNRDQHPRRRLPSTATGVAVGNRFHRVQLPGQW